MSRQGLKSFNSNLELVEVGVYTGFGMWFTCMFVPGLEGGPDPGSLPAPVSPDFHSSSALQGQPGLCCSSAAAL